MNIGNNFGRNELQNDKDSHRSIHGRWSRDCINSVRSSLQKLRASPSGYYSTWYKYKYLIAESTCVKIVRGTSTISYDLQVCHTPYTKYVVLVRFTKLRQYGWKCTSPNASTGYHSSYERMSICCTQELVLCKWTTQIPANNKHNNCITWAHEVYHYTTLRKTLGVTIHIVRASKLICIQDYKAFKIENFPQALKVQ